MRPLQCTHHACDARLQRRQQPQQRLLPQPSNSCCLCLVGGLLDAQALEHSAGASDSSVLRQAAGRGKQTQHFWRRPPQLAHNHRRPAYPAQWFPPSSLFPKHTPATTHACVPVASHLPLLPGTPSAALHAKQDRRPLLLPSHPRRTTQAPHTPQASKHTLALFACFCKLRVFHTYLEVGPVASHLLADALQHAAAGLLGDRAGGGLGRLGGHLGALLGHLLV